MVKDPCLEDVIMTIETAYSLHCSSFLGVPFRTLNIKIVKPKKRNYNGDCRWSARNRLGRHILSAKFMSWADHLPCTHIQEALGQSLNPKPQDSF